MTVPLDLLASYVPRLVVQRLEKDSRPLAEPREEQVPGALLFADIAGFSRLADQLAQNNPAGAEELTALLNDYFGHLIQCVHQHGGDVVKFAGDALLAFWPAGEIWKSSREAALKAAECGLVIQSRLADYQTGGRPLKLRIHLVAGEFRILELGGVAGRWELLLTGEPFQEMRTAGQHREVGLVIACPQAWAILKDHCQGTLLSDGSATITSVPESSTETAIARLHLVPEMEAGLRGSLPDTVFGRISAGQHDWMAELRQITVMFVNLPWFDSRVPLPLAQSVVATIERTAIQFKGSLNKLSMDEKGVTAVLVFGLPPLTHEDDPVRAVMAARVLRETLTDETHAPQIGITTGYSFCGSVGSDLRREYTVIGDNVNLAARLMQHSQDRILCDEPTLGFTEHRFAFRTHDPIIVKGREDQPVPIFEPFKELNASQAKKTKAIGQERQQALIRDVLDRHIEHQQGNVLLIEGEAGIGKSQLLEYLVSAGQNRGYTILSGGGDSIEESSPYHVWRPVLSQLLERMGNKDNSTVAELASERLLAWLNAEPNLLPLAPLFNGILPFDIPENSTTRDMVGQVRGDNLQRLFARMLKREVQTSPLLIVLDDGQWFDSASWAIARRIARRVPNILLAVATRPLEAPVPAGFSFLKTVDQATSILLTPLTYEETRELVCDRLGVSAVPEEVVEWIFQKSEGNPLYSKELIYVLEDSGKLSIEDKKVRLLCPFSELADMNFPNALQGVVRSRVDRLAPPELLTIKTASVIGRQFGFRTLHQTYPIRTDRDKLPAHMETVCQRELVVAQQQEPELIYAFKHAIIQDVTYNLMLFQQRRALHLAIAEWFEAADDQKPIATFSLLAYHWRQAGEDGKARQYEELAGDHALRNGANLEAEAFFRSLISRWRPALPKELSVDEQLHRASLERRLAAALMGVGKLDESRSHCLEALTWLKEATPTSRASRVPRIAGQLFRQCWHRLRKGQVVQEIEKPVYIEGAQVLEQLAEIHYLGNDTLGFLYACLRMLNMAERAGPSPELSRAFANMGLTAATIPCKTFAEFYLRQSRETLETIDHLPSSAWAYFTSGIYLVGLGRWDDARTNLNQALEIYKQLGDDRNYGSAATVLGGSYYFSGNFREGLRIWTEHHERSLKRDDVVHQAWGHGGCALNQLRLGQISEAGMHAEAALALFEDNTERISEIMVQGVLAVARLREQNLTQATSAADSVLTKILNLDRPNSYLLLEGYSAVVEVYLERLRTKPNSSETRTILAMLRSAFSVMKTYAKVFPIGRPRYELWRGYHFWLRQSPDKAVRCWQKSLATAEELEMLYEQALAHWALAQHVSDSRMQQTHLTQALELFTKTEAEYDRKLVESYQADALSDNRG